MATETMRPDETTSHATALTKRILIVNNDPEIIRMLTECLRAFQHGHAYEIASAHNVRDALAILLRAGFGFDLILLEVHISWMGEPRDWPGHGLDLLKEIRKRGVDVPVIMTCPPLEKKGMDEAQSAGAFAWLSGELGELERLVTLALSGPAQGSSKTTPPA